MCIWPITFYLILEDWELWPIRTFKKPQLDSVCLLWCPWNSINPLSCVCFDVHETPSTPSRVCFDVHETPSTPSLAQWNPRRYVTTWLQLYHSSRGHPTQSGRRKAQGAGPSLEVSVALLGIFSQHWLLVETQSRSSSFSPPPERRPVGCCRLL
jgi:hypothetical protein